MKLVTCIGIFRLSHKAASDLHACQTQVWDVMKRNKIETNEVMSAVTNETKWNVMGGGEKKCNVTRKGETRC